jgi:hypothetical protein
MGFIVVKRAKVAAHILTAFATIIDKLNFITAAHDLASHADPVILISKWH